MPLVTLTWACADILSFNEANTTNVWTLPVGTNLLTSAAADPGTANTHEGSSASWGTLADGLLGAPGDKAATVTPNNGETVTFALFDATALGGYDITTIDSCCTWADSGRSNQNYTVQYSIVSDSTNFITLAVVGNGDSPADRSTHTSLTDTTGILASEVHSVRIIFGSPFGQENGYVGMSEFVVTAHPTNVNTVVESGGGNGWTLPAGTNLLNGATALPPTTTSNEGSSPNWTTVTDGLLGAAADIGSSVTPPNNSSVVFPLDTSVNFNGYNLTSFDTYCAWPNSGRDNQDISVSYSTTAAPGVFIKLANAIVRTVNPDNSTHVRITPATGFLATGVAAIKVDFGHQENGYVGYREFIALGTAASISDPLTWTGGSGAAGNANWIAGPDSNWKKTLGGLAANFNPLAALTFDGTGMNRNITLPSALTASSLTFANTAGTPYAIGGEVLTVSNDVVATGNGSATFNNPVIATTGVTQSGGGSLSFNAALQAGGLTLAGSGNLTLNAANPGLTGNASVSDGTLDVSADNGLQNAALVATGGVVRFTSAAPQLASLSGAAGSSVVLGNASGPVDTHLTVGDASSITTFAGDLSAAAGATGSLIKAGASSLFLSGANTYNGTTSVTGGTLQFDQRLSLYNGEASAWTAANLLVGGGATLGFKVGTFDEFTEADLNDLALGGFQPGSVLGISNALDFTLSRSLTQPGIGLFKSGAGILSLTGTNTSNGASRIIEGTIHAASPGGSAIGGSLLMGNAGADVFLTMGADHQFGPDSVLSFANGGFYQSKVNLRGTSQTVAGLDAAAFPANRISLVQNDEIGQPGYTVNPGPASLTIAATGNHSFHGLIRNLDGGAVSVIKTGPGIQEFVNLPNVAGYAYSGPTTIDDGILRLNFSGPNSGFASDITVSAPGTLEFDGTFTFDRAIAGTGDVVKQGAGTVVLTQASYSHTGTTRVAGGVLQLSSPSLADASAVAIDETGTLDLPHGAVDTVAGLTLGLDSMPPGTYAATGNGGPGITETARITGSGKLLVPGSAVSYETWALVIPNETDRDRTDDADGDGFLNVDEFLFGTSPNVANGSLAGFEATGAGLVIRWNQRANSSSVYLLKESTTLLDNPWPPSTAVISDNAVQDLPDYVRKEALIPVDSTRKFVRIEATE